MEENLEETLVPNKKDFFHNETIKAKTRIKKDKKKSKKN